MSNSTNAIEHDIMTPLADAPVMWFMAIAMPLVCLFGIVGNGLAFIILQNAAQKISSFFYIRCLTVFDSLSLLLTMIGFYSVFVLHPLLMYHWPHYKSQLADIWVRQGSCQARTYLAFLSRSLSVWTVVVFSAERAFAVSWPLLSVRFCTVHNARYVIIALAGFALLGNIVWPISFESFKPQNSDLVLCRPKEHMLFLRIGASAMLSVVPALLVCASNYAIVHQLRSRRRNTDTLLAYEDRSCRSRDRNITRQLLAVSCAFVLLTVPNCISVIIGFVYDSWNDKSYLHGHVANLYHLTFLLFTLNFAINFVLYCLTGPNFRRAAWHLACCRWEAMCRYRRALLDTTVSTGTAPPHTSSHNADSQHVHPAPPPRGCRLSNGTKISQV